jgi:hypothetical protein
MKALLMHRDRDFDLERGLPWSEPVLTRDLELGTLLRAMAGDDGFLLDVARKTLFAGLDNDVDTILYRQAVLKDCLKNPDVVRQLYDLAVEAIEARKKSWFGLYSAYPGSVLSGAIGLLQEFMAILRRLRGVAREHGGRFESEAFKAFFTMLEKELSDEYLARVEAHLKALRFPAGVLISADLGTANTGRNYILRQPREEKRNWLQRLVAQRPSAYTFRIDGQDEAGARALGDLREQGIHLVASALGQSTDHTLGFFRMLRTELGFYVGCLNLHGRLAAKGEPTCFPRPVPDARGRHRFRELYDVCLALLKEDRLVGNTVDAGGKSLVVVTGANQGGKSSFLRSIGLAQLMMQCGMFVGAESFDAELCTALFTHYRREEDATMTKGKLDEELARMSEIVDHLVPGAMALFNESFAATNEREGSEIARQIVQALLEKGLKVFFVTHLYEFAHGLFERKTGDTLFLQAERRVDGTRTFRLVEGEPSETSHGEDLYRQLFGIEASPDFSAAP